MRFWRRAPLESLDDDIRDHLERETEDNIGRGMSPRDARFAALRKFGSITLAREDTRAVWVSIWLEQFIQDVRLIVRSSARKPAVPAAVIFTVALAVATNAALFAIFDGLLFRPLPYPNADRIVAVQALPADPFARQRLETALDASPLFADRADVRPPAADILIEDGAESADTMGLRSAGVTPGLFRILAVKPLAGRLLSDDDAGLYAPTPVVIGYDLWRTQFHADAEILGRPIVLPGTEYRLYGALAQQQFTVVIVGIAPPGFDFPAGTNLWHYAAAQSAWLSYALLSPGATSQQVRRAFPAVSVTPLRDDVRPGSAWAAGILLASAGLLMLVAWTQVSALLLARSAGRSTELGVRLALGASRSRLVRQLTAESLSIAALSLAIAWIAAPWLTAGITRLLPTDMTIGQHLSPDRRAFFFTGGLTVVGMVVVGLGPIGVLRKTSPLGLIRGSFSTDVYRGAITTRATLLVSQLAVTTVLLYMAGLALHSLRKAETLDVGFAPENVVAVTMTPTRAGPNVLPFDQLLAKFDEANRTLPTLPGVIAGGAGGRTPFRLSRAGGSWLNTIYLGGRTTLRGRMTYATPGYARALGLRVREGRMLEERDHGTTALVNRTLATELQRVGSPIGQYVSPEVAHRTYTVVGVVDDVVVSKPETAAEPEVFAPPQVVRSSDAPVLLARLDGSNPASVPAIRSMLERVFPDYPEKTIVRVEDEARRATADFRSRSIVLGAIALLCVPLAMGGIVGALMNAVHQQTREIGIRLALGAEAHDVRRRIVAGTLKSTALGLGLGLAGVVALLLGTAWAAALWPAYRASRIDPAVVLRDA